PLSMLRWPGRAPLLLPRAPDSAQPRDAPARLEAAGHGRGGRASAAALAPNAPDELRVFGGEQPFHASSNHARQRAPRPKRGGRPPRIRARTALPVVVESRAPARGSGRRSRPRSAALLGE